MRGTKASVIIKQGKEQNFKPVLYIEPAAGTDMKAFESAIMDDLKKINDKYPGVELKKNSTGWEVIIPDKFKVGHEDHFAQVAKAYFQYLRDGEVLHWNFSNMLAQYYTTTKAREVALAK